MPLGARPCRGMMSAVPWTRPTECDRCEHPISAHVLWEPDEICDGWMHCIAPDCMTCWHHWPKLSDDRATADG
jgi:hypothetical protein